MTWKVELEYDRSEESYEAKTLEDLAKAMIADGRLSWDKIRYLDLSKTATDEEETEFAAIFKKMSTEGATLYEEMLLHNDEKKLNDYLQSALNTFTAEIIYCNSVGVLRAKGRAEEILKGCFLVFEIQIQGRAQGEVSETSQGQTP